MVYDLYTKKETVHAWLLNQNAAEGARVFALLVIYNVACLLLTVLLDL